MAASNNRMTEAAMNASSNRNRNPASINNRSGVTIEAKILRVIQAQAKQEAAQLKSINKYLSKVHEYSRDTRRYLRNIDKVLSSFTKSSASGRKPTIPDKGPSTSNNSTRTIQPPRELTRTIQPPKTLPVADLKLLSPPSKPEKDVPEVTPTVVDSPEDKPTRDVQPVDQGPNLLGLVSEISQGLIPQDQSSESNEFNNNEPTRGIVEYTPPSSEEDSKPTKGSKLVELMIKLIEGVTKKASLARDIRAGGGGKPPYPPGSGGMSEVPPEEPEDDEENSLFGSKGSKDINMSLIKMFESSRKSNKYVLEAAEKFAKTSGSSLNISTMILKLVEGLCNFASQSINDYAKAYEKTLAQMVSTTGKSQDQYNDLILYTTSLVRNVTDHSTEVTDTIRILSRNYLDDTVSMVKVVGENFAKLSAKGITGDNIGELAIYDQLFELIAYGFDLTSQHSLDQIRLYGNQSAITSGASYISIRNQLNNLFGDTQYLLNGIYEQVMNQSSIAFNSYVNAKRRAEAESAFQQSLALMYESGVSNQTIETWSSALSSLMAGDLSALSGDAGASILLAMRESGVQISEIVSGALSGSSIKALYMGMVRSAINATNDESNMIYKNAIAKILGTDVTTLTGDRLEEAYAALQQTEAQSNDQLLKVLNKSVGQAGESLTLEQKMKNTMDNIAVNMTTGMVGLGSGIISSITNLGTFLMVGLAALILSKVSVMGTNIGVPIGAALLGIGGLIALNSLRSEGATSVSTMTESFQTNDEKLGITSSMKEQHGIETDYSKNITNSLNEAIKESEKSSAYSSSGSSSSGTSSAADISSATSSATDAQKSSMDDPNDPIKLIYGLLSKIIDQGNNVIRSAPQFTDGDYISDMRKSVEEIKSNTGTTAINTTTISGNVGTIATNRSNNLVPINNYSVESDPMNGR